MSLRLMKGKIYMECEISAGAYYQQFWAEEKAREAARLAEKINIRKQQEVLAKLRNPCNGKKILEYGQICGCGVQHGGREGTYLIAPDGSRQPVSVHPKDVSPGLRNAVRKFLERVVVQRVIAAQAVPALAT